MTTPAAPRRRWFRYSLRTFFIVLTIFCVWLGVQVKWIRDRHEALEWHARHNWRGGKYLTGPNPDFPWSLAILGEGRINCIAIGLDGDESKEELAYIERIKTLFPETEVLVEPNPP